MKAKYTAHIVIPTLLAGLLAGVLAGCSGGSADTATVGAQSKRVAMGDGLPAASYAIAKWGGGGYVTGLIYHPVNSSVMYARTDVGGAYRWNNSGGTWTPLNDGPGFGGGETSYHSIESIGLDPTNDQKVYMVTGISTHDWNGAPINGRLYVSNDRGNSWTHYDLPFPVGGNENGRGIGERLQLDPTNPSTMFYASRTAGLWKSTDSGLTWQQTGLSSKVLSMTELAALSDSPAGVEQIMLDNANPNGNATTATTWNMYAAISPDYAQKAGLTSTLYKSTNGGYSWTPVPVPSSVSGYHVPHFVRSSDGYYYVVFNKDLGPGGGGPGYLYKFGGVAHGETWTQLSTTTQGGYAGVSVSGTGSTARIALTVTGTWSSGQPVIQLSDNDGAPGTWREIADGMTHWGPGGYRGWVSDVKIDPAAPNHIMHVHGGGIWETWEASSTTPRWDLPLNNFEETCPLSLVTPPAGTSYKFVQSTGDVGTWLQTDLAAQPTKGPDSNWTNGYTADLLWSDPTFIVGTGGLSYNNHTPFGFWSGDGGNTWSNFATLPPGAADSGEQSIAVTSRNNVILATRNSVPYWSSNNGASWNATNLPAPTTTSIASSYHLAVDRKNPNKVYAYDAGAANWTNTPGKVYVSTDGGHNFTLSQGSVPANLAPNAFGSTSLVVNPNVEGDLWLADGNAVYHSTDSGASWTKLSGFATVAPNGSRGQMQGASLIALGKAQTGSTYSAAIYVVGTRDGVWGIYRSDNVGATWTRFNDDAHQYGGIGPIAGDWNTYGRIYFAGAGRGVIYTN